MRLIKLLAAVVAGAATLVLPRRRSGRLRLDRARAALRLAARGGARYAASAPRLFAAAGEQRQLLREDLALRTAEDVAGTLGAMKGVMMKIGQMASYVDDGLSPAVRHTLARLQDSVYDTIREPGPLTITSDYASSVVHRFFDLRSPVADYISVPRPYVILQRINLGLFAVLGELSATADWRAISEEIWPFVHGPAATPMGEAEATWQARRQAGAA